MDTLLSGYQRVRIKLCAIGLAGLLLIGAAGSARADSFATWLAEFRLEAIAAGISLPVLDREFANLTPNPKILALDRRQTRKSASLTTYLRKRLTSRRIKTGQKLMAQWRHQLVKIGHVYRVQPRFIVALWGLETNYGSYTGDFSVIRSLATLAHDPRRGSYFRKELLAALQILDQGHINNQEMTGSWAGAMGQSQFMPTSFLQLAVDQDGDNRKDIWHSYLDIFGSIANYLAQRSRWNDHQTWGRAVRLPRHFDRNLITHSRKQFKWLLLSAWQQHGVRKTNGVSLPSVQLKAALIQPDGSGGQAYLVYPNFQGIMLWNASFYFGISVGLLADALYVEPW